MVQDFCSLRIKITQFPGGFCPNFFLQRGCLETTATATFYDYTDCNFILETHIFFPYLYKTEKNEELRQKWQNITLLF